MEMLPDHHMGDQNWENDWYMPSCSTTLLTVHIVGNFYCTFSFFFLSFDWTVMTRSFVSTICDTLSAPDLNGWWCDCRKYKLLRTVFSVLQFSLQSASTHPCKFCWIANVGVGTSRHWIMVQSFCFIIPGRPHSYWTGLKRNFCFLFGVAIIHFCL